MLGGLYLCHNVIGDFSGANNASPQVVGPCSWAVDPALLPAGGTCLFRFGGALTGAATVTFRLYLGGGRYRPGVTGTTDGTLVYTSPAVTGPLTPLVLDVGQLTFGPGLTRMKFGYTSSGGNWTLDNWFVELFSLLPTPPVGSSPPDPTLTERGDDLDVRSDLNRSSFSLADGVRNIGNAIARRLITPRGGLVYDPAYGTDVRAYLSAGMTAAQVARLASEIQAEVNKDPRVGGADVSLAIAGTTMLITVLVDLAQGPFELVFRVTGLTVELLTVAAAGTA